MFDLIMNRDNKGTFTVESISVKGRLFLTKEFGPRVVKVEFPNTFDWEMLQMAEGFGCNVDLRFF